MSRTKSTNILLVLTLIALVANIVLTFAWPPAAYAVKKSGVSTDAQEVSNRVAMDRVLGDISPAMREMAASSRDVATAIREQARATERIARAIQEAGRRDAKR